MRRLHLLRHAKSSWDEPMLADRDRPLAPRGRKATRRLARWLAEHDVRPDVVVCSPAVRARETVDGIVPALDVARVFVDERLYHATAPALLGRARELPSGASEAMLVGHNPGLAELCLLLARPGELRGRIEAKLPTGALVSLEADVDEWADLAPGCAEIVGLVLPRDLG